MDFGETKECHSINSIQSLLSKMSLYLIECSTPYLKMACLQATMSSAVRFPVIFATCQVPYAFSSVGPKLLTLI